MVWIFLFLKKRNSFHILNKTHIVKETIVSSFMDCLKFQANSTDTEVIRGLNSLNCRFVTNDNKCYGEGYDNEIFVGNAKFSVGRLRDRLHGSR